MKLKQVKNEIVNSFEFSFDLRKGMSVRNLLLLFGVREVYLNFYGWQSEIVTLQKEKFLFLPEKNQLSVKTTYDLVINFLKEKYDEVLIWNQYIDWNSFIAASQEEMNLFSIKREPKKTRGSFFLDFSPYDFNDVKIICDLSLGKCASVTKEKIISCFDF